MDLASVVAALASVGVRVSGSTPNNNIQGDSSRACPTGLAGPEPSGTLNDPGQHFHSDDDHAEQDDYTVEKILAQRPNASAPGGLEFKVRWRGYGPSHDTWEPVSSFVPRINTPFMDYIRKHKTKMHVSDLAALTRAIAARSARSSP